MRIFIREREREVKWRIFSNLATFTWSEYACKHDNLFAAYAIYVRLSKMKEHNNLGQVSSSMKYECKHMHDIIIYRPNMLCKVAYQLIHQNIVKIIPLNLLEILHST